ncbi:MAG: molybdopterin-dependent oxidoreductase [Sulfurovum sp.]|nr:MAG: molybdopterin-dependent oxidoreductase [Sulfurovum sp.]
MINTACCLDCPDVCDIEVNGDKISHSSTHPTSNGTLCSLLNREFSKAQQIKKARVDGVEVSLDEALLESFKLLSLPKKLLWRGSGNMGVMSEITNLLFSKIGGTLTKGSLCDGAGDAGIIAGRGVNRLLPYESIEKAEVVVVWGKNISVTASHLMPYLEGKKLVVIDPIKTKIASNADLFIQIKPRSDIYLAILLARFVMIAGDEDKEFLKKFAPSYEEYYEFTRTFRIKAPLEHIGIDLDVIGHLLVFLQNPKVVHIVGNGVQKYSIGAEVLRAIDALAVVCGHFGKVGCGVSFMGNSRLGFINPFEVKLPKVSKVATPFEKFDVVLVQNGNPVASMPNSSRVKESLQKTKLIYFGVYENETSQMADIVIPASNFLQKNDVRLSYANHDVKIVHKAMESDSSLSEYEFCHAMFKTFGLDGLLDEQYYIDFWLNQTQKIEGKLYSPTKNDCPYSDGFGEEGDEDFEFMDDFDDDFLDIKALRKARKQLKSSSDEELWLITVKSKHSLNTQFKRDHRVFIHPSFGFNESQKVKLSNEWGEAIFEVSLDSTMREDSVLVYNSAFGVNNLTPDSISNEGESACYGDVKVKIEGL